MVVTARFDQPLTDHCRAARLVLEMPLRKVVKALSVSVYVSVVSALPENEPAAPACVV
jgi:hypothetical protein